MKVVQGLIRYKTEIRMDFEPKSQKPPEVGRYSSELTRQWHKNGCKIQQCETAMMINDRWVRITGRKSGKLYCYYVDSRPGESDAVHTPTQSRVVPPAPAPDFS